MAEAFHFLQEDLVVDGTRLCHFSKSLEVLREYHCPHWRETHTDVVVRAKALLVLGGTRYRVLESTLRYENCCAGYADNCCRDCSLHVSVEDAAFAWPSGEKEDDKTGMDDFFAFLHHVAREIRHNEARAPLLYYPDTKGEDSHVAWLPENAVLRDRALTLVPVEAL